MTSSASIQRAEVEGRPATVAYLKLQSDGTVQPGTPEDYDALKVVFDSGEVVWATPEKKVTKTEAEYEPVARGKDRCDVCAHFEPNNKACTRVQGRIAPEAWCRLFEKY